MNTVEIKYNEANELYENKDYNKALIAYKEYCDLVNNEVINIDVYIRMAKCYEKNNDLSEVIECYNKVIEINPNNSDIYSARGKIYTKLEQFNDALNDFNKAIKLNPPEADYYANRADSKRYLRKYQEALKDYDKAIEINSSVAEYYKKRSIVKNFLKMYDEATLDYKHAIKLKPSLSDENTNYSSSGIVEGATLEAINEDSEYNTINDNNIIDYYYNIGINRINKKVYSDDIPQTDKKERVNRSKSEITNEFLIKANEKYNSDEYAEALEYYEKYIKNADKEDIDGDTYFNMGYSADVIGDDNKAIGYYKKALADYEKYCELANEEDIDSYIYFRMGNSADVIGDEDKAIEYYSKCVELDPNVIIYTLRGLAYRKKGEYNRAIEDYTKAIELDSNDPICVKDRAKCYYFNLKDYEKALVDYEKYCELADKEDIDSGIYFRMAYSAVETGDDDKGLEYYSKCIELNLSNDSAYNNRGNIYKRKEEYDKAIEDYTKAIELDSNDSLYIKNRAECYYEDLKDYEKALADYEKYCELANEEDIDSGIYFRMAYSAVETGDDDKGLEYYNKYINLDPNDGSAYNNRGLIYKRKGEYNRAIEDYTKAIEINATFKRYKNRAECYYEDLKDYKKALADYEKYCELANEEDIGSDIYFYMGYSAVKIGDDDKGLEYYNKSIELNLSSQYAYNNRGNIYKRKEDYEKAIEDFTNEIINYPSDTLAYKNRAECYYENLEDYEKALADYEKYCELAEDPDSDVYFRMGYCYDEMVDYDKAFENYNKCIELDPSYCDAYQNRAVLYEKTKNFDKAILDFTKALEINPNNLILRKYRAECYYFNIEDYEKALADYEKLIELDSENKEEHQAIIDELREKISSTCDEEVEDQSNEFQTCFNNGMNYYDNNNYEKAIEYFNKCLELNSKVGEVYLKRANCYYMLNWYYEAKTDYDKYISMVSSYYIYSLFNMAECEKQLGNFEAAVKLYEKYLEDDPNDVSALEECMKLYKSLKNYPKTLEHCDKLLSIDEDNVNYHKTKADALYLCKRNELQTIDEFNFVIENSKDKNIIADANAKVAECYALSKNYEMAISCISKAISFSPKIRLYFLRAQYYENIGSAPSALGDYKKVLKNSSDRKEQVDSENKIKYLSNLKNIRVNVEKCTLVEIMSIEGVTHDIANKFFKLREEKKWYEIESFAKDLGLFNPKFLTSRDAQRLEFSLKPKADYGKRMIDF